MALSLACPEESTYALDVTTRFQWIARFGRRPVSCAATALSLALIPPLSDCFLNPDGFRDQPIAGTVLSKYTLDPEKPLTFFDGKTGDLYRVGFETITTDGGSVPRLLQVIPGFEARRFMRAYPIHDGGFQRGYLYVCRRNDPFVFVRVDVTQAFMDDLLRRMVIAEGRLVLQGHPEWTPTEVWIYEQRIRAISTTVYYGLRVGGWVAWNNYRREGWKVAPAV